MAESDKPHPDVALHASIHSRHRLGPSSKFKLAQRPHPLLVIVVDKLSHTNAARYRLVDKVVQRLVTQYGQHIIDIG